MFCTCIATIAMFYNLFGSPDVLYDEAAYTWAAQQVALGWHLTLDNQPLFVHPPLPFLVQAVWLRLTGYAAAPLASAIHSARLLAATAGTADVLLTGGLAYRLASGATGRRRRLLTAAVTVLAALDPVLSRYDRQNVIEPFALFVSLLVLHAAWHLRHRSALRYVSVTGLLGGLALLTNEITIFLVLVPPLFALLLGDRKFTRRAVAALSIALCFLGVFLAWAAELGLAGQFIFTQTTTLQRFIGLLQLNGLNRPGVSLAASVRESIVTFTGTGYASTYIMLAAGLAALAWCWSRWNSESGTFLTAWLTASYACGGYIVAIGTLNEQFFVYLLPGVIVGSVFLADALITGAWRRRDAIIGRRRAARRAHPRLPSVVGGSAFALVACLSSMSWTANYGGGGDGVVQAVAYVTARLPSCAAVNASGDTQKYEYLTGGLITGRSFAGFSVGPAALADGVHYFLLAPTDAAELNGDMTPALEAWIRANGRELAVFPSQVYDTVQVWYVPLNPFDPVADTVDIPGGVFINTVGSHCGGYAVTGDHYTVYLALGGKSVIGAPLSRPVTISSGESLQLFDGAVVSGVRALPIVEMFAERAARAYLSAGLPPVRWHATGAQRRSWLTDQSITSTYLDGGSYAAAVSRYGEPLGPPAALPGGGMAQAFADIVLEDPGHGQAVHAVPVTAAAVAAGVLHVPTAARAAQADPPLPNPTPIGTAEPDSAEPFVVTLGGVLTAYAAVVATIFWRRQRRGRREIQTEEGSDPGAASFSGAVRTPGGHQREAMRQWP